MKKIVKILLVMLVLGGTYYLYSISYLNWDFDKKSDYQFHLIQRELRKNPEKLGKIQVIVKESMESVPDTLSPEEITQLTPYPSHCFVHINIPSEEGIYYVTKEKEDINIRKESWVEVNNGYFDRANCFRLESKELKTYPTIKKLKRIVKNI